MTVLLVDDDAGTRQVFREILEMEGHKTLAARSGEEALRLLERMEPPELMLVDCSMPQMSGAEFLSRARTRFPALFERTRVVGFSSFGRGLPMTRAFEAQVHEVVEKPYDIHVFEKIIRRFAETLTARTA